MARPKRIILVRHGESEGNLDRKTYTTIPDFSINLTTKGKLQAYDAGKELRKIVGDESIRFYNSSFFRARATTDYILKSFKDTEHSVREDLRLIEMGWGNLVTYEQQLKMLDERDSYSHFYYRGLNAENGVDLYVRLSSFLDTLHRDFENSKFEDNCIIVSHGLTIRMFISRWLHLSVEDYEEIKNPKNCEYFILELNPETNKYQLSKPLEKHNIYHDWRYVKDNDEYSDSLIQEHEILQKELSSNMILEEKIPTTQSTFYDIKHLSIDKKIKLLEHAIDIRTKAWIDKLDCSISIARQQVTDMTFPDIVNKLENRSHFVVIKRYDFCKNQYYGEIGFSTNPDIDGVTYFLFIYVLMNNLNDIVNKYDLVNHI